MPAGALLVLAFFYLLGLAVQMPMRVLVGQLSLPTGVHLDGADDSAWAGTVRTVVVAGRDLGRLDYVINPWKIFRGEIEYSVALDTGRGQVDAAIKHSLWSGAFGLRDVRAEVDARLFEGFLMAADVARGEVFVLLDSIAFRRGDHFHMDGRGEWRGLLVGSGNGVGFGTVDFELRPESAGTVIDFASRDGELVAAGNVFIDAEGRYESRIQVREGDALTDAGRSLLNLVRSVDDEGILKHANKLF